MPTEDLSEDNWEEDCDCDYPHMTDFDPYNFEQCDCTPSCYHIAPLFPPEPDEEDEGTLLGIDR